MTKSELIFGKGLNAPPIERLARVVGVAPSTLRRWRKAPDYMPVWAVGRILKARGVKPELWADVFK